MILQRLQVWNPLNWDKLELEGESFPLASKTKILLRRLSAWSWLSWHKFEYFWWWHRQAIRVAEQKLIHISLDHKNSRGTAARRSIVFPYIIVPPFFFFIIMITDGSPSRYSSDGLSSQVSQVLLWLYHDKTWVIPHLSSSLICSLQHSQHHPLFFHKLDSDTIVG